MYLEDLLFYIKDYESQYKELILKAYHFANDAHKGVLRKSGEPYIIHPVSVACILAEMKADADTIAAGLLHDTIEDCDGVTREVIAHEFNENIASLVDGVTNISKIKFNNDKRLANQETQRKIVESILKDIRILIIKLADRLHNMRTMQYQTPNKQIEKSTETMDFFVPFATLIGEYNFKRELEDLSFQYLNLDEYNKIKKMREDALINDRPMIEQIIFEVSELLNHKNIPFELKLQIKNIYGLFYKLSFYPNIDYVHDLYSVELILKDKDTCYYVFDEISNLYRTLYEKDRDYISNPKTNMYRGLHRSIYMPNKHIIQLQMKTKDMYMINAYGLPAYWSTMSLQDPVGRMQRDVRNLQFYHLLEQLVQKNASTQEFNIIVKDDILKDKISVYTPSGEVKTLPEGSTAVDLAYLLHTEIGNNIIGVKINGENNDLSTALKNGDIVEIIYDDRIDNTDMDILPYCHTEYAKKMVLEKRMNRK